MLRSIAALSVAVAALGALASSAGTARPNRSSPLMMNAPPTLTQACQKVSGAVRRERAIWRVICPTRVPLTIAPLVSVAGANLATGDFRRGYIFGCLGRAVGSPLVHWTFASGTRHDLAYLLNPQHAYRLSAVALRLEGRDVQLYLIPPGAQALYSDHVVIEWTQGGQEYQISIHRWPNTQRATAQATAMAKVVIQQIKDA